MASLGSSMLAAFIILGLGFAHGDKDSFKVFNGNDARPNAYPYMVALFYEDSSGNQKFFCGGALVAERFVLTAAHCIFNGKLTAYLGAHNVSDYESSQQRIAIVRGLQHPSYTYEETYSLAYDFGLYELELPANITTGFVETISINRNKKRHDKVIRKKQKATLTGWGLKKFYEGWKPSEILQKLDVNFIDDAECDERGNYRPETAACYESAKDECSGSCNGDSGSPIVIKARGSYTLMAVHSYRMDNNDGCATGVKGSHKTFMIGSFLDDTV